jgi:serine/threonine protein kinase
MEPAKRTTEIYEKILAGDLSFDVPLAQGVRGYELGGELGQGAYGSIHRAIQPSVGREVAVKVIRRKYANDAEFIRRFEAEAQTVARLEHPFIVPLYDYWRDPDGAYLVMRYMRGGSLLSSLAAGPWNLESTAKMLDQVAGALSVAHRQGVVHRDIKPANILLDESGNAFLSDFGIAKSLTVDMELTATGAILGTPDYISPEQIKNDPVGPQTDIYSLGAVLYETLTGEKPFADSTLANLVFKHLNEPIPLVSASRPDLPTQIDTVIQRATAKHPADRYADALEMSEAFHLALTGKGIAGPMYAPVLVPAGSEIVNPYKGLRPFQEADAEDFFGREALVEQLVRRMTPSKDNRVQESRFLAVVGPSGSGKSSAVKAGLIPALREGAVPGSAKWFVAEMVPGTHPLEELELALWPVSVDPPPSLVEPMERDIRGVLRTIRRVLPDEDDVHLLLVIDQFEELFTTVTDDERRTFFINSLLAAVKAPRSPIRVVATLRADFYDRPLQIPHLANWIKNNTELALPLTPEELSWAIREPARRVGIGLEEGLTEAIVVDVADQPGALPMLQYTLTELFEARQNNMMTRTAYQEMGGVMGALGSRAEEIYGDLKEPEQETTRQLFLRLITLGEGAEDTRRRVLRSELQPVRSQAIFQML